MTDDPALRALLVKYLASAETANGWRDDIKAGLAHLADQQLKTTDEMRRGFSDIHSDLKVTKTEQNHLAQRVEFLEDREEITGVEHRVALQRKLDSQRVRAKESRKWAAQIVGALVVALLSAGTALAVRALIHQ